MTISVDTLLGKAFARVGRPYHGRRRWGNISPHEAQQQILDAEARYKVLACGRRFGKTDLCVFQQGSEVIDRGLPYGYFAPTYKMLAEVWRTFKRELRDRIVAKNETEKRLELAGGGSIEFWSLDSANAIRGRKYAGVVIDEAAWVPDLEDAWNSVIQPTLIDRGGWAWFASTPNGRNYFFTLYLRGTGTPGWWSGRYPTAANPFIPAAEIEAAQALLPDRTFRQEYLAEFVEDAGAVFRNLSACTTSTAQDGPQDGHRYVFGVDWGRDSDFTAIAVLDTTDRRQVALERFNQVGWSLQRGRLAALAALWQPDAIWAEENSIGGPNIEALQHEGLPVLPFTTTAQSKGPLIESLALAFERRELAILNDPVQLGELQAYSMARLPSGRFAYSAPHGLHDDTVIALALAWYGAEHSGNVISFV